MIKVVLICVNYDSDNSLKKYLDSIENARNSAKSSVELSVHIADNTLRPKGARLDLGRKSCSFPIEVTAAPDNPGYIGGVRAAVTSQGIEPTHWDYLIVSNVDITLDESFFRVLSRINLPDAVGIVAPSILTGENGADNNPFMSHRPSRGRMRFYKWLYRWTFLFAVYQRISRRRKRRARRAVKVGRERSDERIYAPHGAFMIFTREYFRSGGDFSFPCFLFNEEIYFAEKARQKQLAVVYAPELVVRHEEHQSTDRQSFDTTIRFRRDSADFVYGRYFS